MSLRGSCPRTLAPLSSYREHLVPVTIKGPPTSRPAAADPVTRPFPRQPSLVWKPRHRPRCPSRKRIPGLSRLWAGRGPERRDPKEQPLPFSPRAPPAESARAATKPAAARAATAAPVPPPPKVLEAGGLGMRNACTSAPREVSWSDSPPPPRSLAALRMRGVEAGRECVCGRRALGPAWILESVTCYCSRRRLGHRIAGEGHTAVDVSTWRCESIRGILRRRGRGWSGRPSPGKCQPGYLRWVGLPVGEEGRADIAFEVGKPHEQKTAQWEGGIDPFEEWREEGVWEQSNAGTVQRVGKGKPCWTLVFILRNFHLPFFARKKSL